MFTNLCLILLLLLAGSLQFRNFTFNYRKKAKKKSRKGSNIVQLADSVTAVAQLYDLYSHTARSFNPWQRALYPNFIIISLRMNIVSGIKSVGQRPHCSLRVQIKRLFIGRLTDFYDDLKVVREIEVCCDDTFSPQDWKTDSSRTGQQQLGEITL